MAKILSIALFVAVIASNSVLATEVTEQGAELNKKEVVEEVAVEIADVQ